MSFGKSIKEGMAAAIAGEFGEEYTIVDNEVMQNLDDKTFYIRSYSMGRTDGLSNRFRMRYSFEVTYYDENADEDALKEISERLFSCLWQIKENDNLTYGEEMRSEVTDDVLHFFVDYKLHLVEQQEEEPTFETMQIREGVK